MELMTTDQYKSFIIDLFGFIGTSEIRACLSSHDGQYVIFDHEVFSNKASYRFDSINGFKLLTELYKKYDIFGKSVDGNNKICIYENKVVDLDRYGKLYDGTSKINSNRYAKFTIEGQLPDAIGAFDKNVRNVLRLRSYSEFELIEAIYVTSIERWITIDDYIKLV